MSDLAADLAVVSCAQVGCTATCAPGPWLDDGWVRRGVRYFCPRHRPREETPVTTPTTPRPMWKLAAAAAANGWDCHITHHGPTRIRLTLELRDRWDPSPQHIATATWAWEPTGWRLDHATWDDRPGAPWASGPVQVRLRDLHKLATKGPSTDA